MNPALWWYQQWLAFWGYTIEGKRHPKILAKKQKEDALRAKKY
jgi:hypothetical protein